MKKSSLFFAAFLVIMFFACLNGCKHEPDDTAGPGPGPGNCDTSNVTYNGTVIPIFQENCVFCHNSNDLQGGIDLTNYSQVAFLAENGFLVGAIKHLQGYSPMPKDGNKLDDCKIRQVEIWVRDTTFAPPQGCDTSNVTYNGTVYPILQTNCVFCHSGAAPEAGIDLTDYAQVSYLAENGILIGAIKHLEGFSPMPKDANKLDDCKIRQIEIWIRDTTFTPPPPDDPCDPDTVYFEADLLPIIASSCGKTGCHDGTNPDEDAVRLDSYAAIMASGFVVPGNPGQSEMVEVITETDPEKRMPPPPDNPLPADQIALIQKWIAQGAQNLFCESGCDTVNVTFSGVIWPEIIGKHCYGCHKGAEAGGGIHLENYNDVAAAAAIPAGQPGSLWGAVTHASGNLPMPRNQPKLSDCKISQIQIWIEDGRPNN